MAKISKKVYKPVLKSKKSVLIRDVIKDQIKALLGGIKDPEVEKIVADFFLKDMANYLEEINQLLDDISEPQRNAIEIEKRFAHFTNLILLKGHALENKVCDKNTTRKVKENFRLLVSDWAYKSPLVKNGFEKSRGYPGDYMMLEAVYNSIPSGETVGLIFDKYFLSNPYAVAVRYRKDRLRALLADEIQHSTPEKFKIYNIACGSCREIKELPKELFNLKKVLFTCVDWDEEALKFSQRIFEDYPDNVHFNFIQEDIMNIIRNTDSLESFEKQDLVYSIGLIDYLPDRILKSFMQFFYGLVKEDGKLILTHKNREKAFSPLAPDWFCDWKFIPRNKEETVKLFYNCGIKDFSLDIQADDFNDIFYFTISKR